MTATTVAATDTAATGHPPPSATTPPLTTAHARAHAAVFLNMTIYPTRYVTDYMLCVFMSYGVFSLYTKTPDSPLRTRSMALFGLYAASVLSGAVAHQTMTSLDLINSDSFKWLWCVCVGTVAAAGGVMGSILNHLTQVS